MKRTLIIFLTVFSFVVLYSCSKSNDTELSQSSGRDSSACDTTNMSFTADIKPILQANCYACHSNSNFAISSTKLEDYGDLIHHVHDGDILGSISHAPGFVEMPQGAPKLSDCNINKIKAWIDRGALDN
jgi:hypothetical protein